MSNFVLIILCFGLGVLLDRLGRFPKNAVDALNAFLIHISVPALALLYVHDLPLNVDTLLPLSMAWIVFAAGLLLFKAIGRACNMSPQTYGCLALTSALGNTGFVGYPMISAFFGAEALGLGIICDQGTFFAMSLPGMLLAARLSSSETPSMGGVLKKLLSFPPLLAVIAGLFLHEVEYPALVVDILQKLSATLTPLALISVGLSIPFGAFRARFWPLALGLSYKLLVAPALILALFGAVMGLRGDILTISVFSAAMPPMVLGGVLAREHDLAPDLASLIVGIGTPIGLLTAPCWRFLLQFFG
ncbi:MAG: malate permease [Desulfovibrionales bacterium]|nr:malate permease [Desulfovibrionales bacterium]